MLSVIKVYIANCVEKCTSLICFDYSPHVYIHLPVMLCCLLNEQYVLLIIVLGVVLTMV